MERNTRLLLLTCLLLLAGYACGRRNGDDPEAMEPGERPGSAFSYEEGDTLRRGARPPVNLEAWFDYYAKVDTAFRSGNFRSSGVRIHIDSFGTVPAPPSGQSDLMEPLFAYSPDSSGAIDIWSFNLIMETDKKGTRTIAGGGPDQQVVWIDKRTGNRWQVLFNGPTQSVETADWVDDRSFLLGMMNIDEPLGQWTPEILLFDLVDSAYVNFRYARPLSIDSLPRAKEDFITTWLRARGLKRG